MLTCILTKKYLEELFRIAGTGLLKAHPRFPYFLEKHLAIPTSHLLVNVLVFLASILILRNPYLPYIGGRIWWAEKNFNDVSHLTISDGASKDFILVHSVQLKTMIKAHSSVRMVSSGISDVVIASVHSEKTCLKKLMMMMMMMMMIILSEKPFTSK